MANNNEEIFQNHVKSFYDNLKIKKKYSYYSDWKWFRKKHTIAQFNQTRDSIKKILTKKYKFALEIGPGDGIWTELFINYVQKLDAIEISNEMRNLFLRRFNNKENIKIILGDILNAPLKKYDLIYTIRCFEYIPNKLKVIKKLSGSLNNGGDLIIITKNPEFFQIKNLDKRLHSKQININDLSKMLEENNFKVIKIIPAVFGKYFQIPFLRFFYNYLHKRYMVNYKKGKVKNKFVESYLIFARKNDFI